MRANGRTRACEIEALAYLELHRVPLGSPAVEANECAGPDTAALHEALAPLGLPDPPARVTPAFRYRTQLSGAARSLTVCAAVLGLHFGAWKVVFAAPVAADSPAAALVDCRVGRANE
jgi:hypothetical protein